MNNLVRKALRVEIAHVIQLRDSLPRESYEWTMLNRACLMMIDADYYDFHVNPKKRYRIPKTDFQYEQ